jgi:hypothetical protein
LKGTALRRSSGAGSDNFPRQRDGEKDGDGKSEMFKWFHQKLLESETK